MKCLLTARNWPSTQSTKSRPRSLRASSAGPPRQEEIKTFETRATRLHSDSFTKSCDGDSTRSIYRRHWAKLSTPEEVNSACAVLEEFRYSMRADDDESPMNLL